MLWLFMFIIISIIILIIAEYTAHDCKPGKECTHKCDSPTLSDNPEEYIDKLRKMVQVSYDYVAWRQSLLVSLILLIPIIYFMYERLPNFYEFFVITTILFIGFYLSSIWIWTHFFYPNGASIEKSLLELRDQLTNDVQDEYWEDIMTLSDIYN